jgi:hypothetical protein
MPVISEVGGLPVVDHVISEAAVKLLDVVRPAEQPRRLRARGKRNRQITGQTAGACPLEEVAHGPAAGAAVGEPTIEICLGEVAQ